MHGATLVTGANGHLGNTLVRRLVARGLRVRAGVRDPADRAPFAGIDPGRLEVVRAELLDPATLGSALAGVETLYQVGAVFRHWARDPRREIVEANLAITRNALEAAAAAGVRRVVYVSSASALDWRVVPVSEATWNRRRTDPYWHSKAASERLALDLAAQLGLALCTVLPWSMVGPNVHRAPTDTMAFLLAVLEGRLPFDPGFRFNFVHVEDVAEAMIAAAERGRSGQRYLLCNEQPVSSRRVLELARALRPELPLRREPPRALLQALAAASALGSRVLRRAPALTCSTIEAFHHADLRADVSRARRELGFDPRPGEQAVAETLEYLSSSGLARPLRALRP